MVLAKFNRRWARRLTAVICVLISGLVLGSCAMTAIRVLSARPPMPEFMKKDCETESGSWIYQWIDHVDGYLDSTNKGLDSIAQGCGSSCRDKLRNRWAKYIEVHVDRAEYIARRATWVGMIQNWDDFKLGHLVQGPGHYRFTLQKQGDPRCKLFEDFLQMTYKERLEGFAGICIATEKVDHFISRYEITSEASETKTSDGEYSKFTTRVIDRTNGQILFEGNHFGLRQRNLNRTGIGCRPRSRDIGASEFLLGPHPPLICRPKSVAQKGSMTPGFAAPHWKLGFGSHVFLYGLRCEIQ